ncbi:hypothetical protein [Salinifilum aidingensis]
MLNFFRRRGAAAEAERADPDARAAAFWQRWDELLPEITSALADGHPQHVEPLVSDLVQRVHPKLGFSLEHGSRATYALVVSGEADPELRPYTDAWMRAAPEPDQAWEYHDAIPPVPDPMQVTVHVRETPYALADVRVVTQVDSAAGVIDVAVHHPGFAEAEERSRTALALMALDAALGERLAADRLGRIETAELPPESTVDLARLRELAEGMERTGADPGHGGAATS